jgi:imidazolonepropionase-like amidohydrolase
MPEIEAFSASTWRPAAALGLAAEAGTLLPNAAADLCGLRWSADALQLVDTSGGTRPGGCWEPVFVVKAGEIVVE